MSRKRPFLEALHELIEKDLEERFIRSPDESTDPAAPGGDPSSSTPQAGDTTMTSAVDIGMAADTTGGTVCGPVGI